MGWAAQVERSVIPIGINDYPKELLCQARCRH
jgi:hypothetical protein